MLKLPLALRSNISRLMEACTHLKAPNIRRAIFLFGQKSLLDFFAQSRSFIWRRLPRCSGRWRQRGCNCGLCAVCSGLITAPCHLRKKRMETANDLGNYGGNKDGAASNSDLRFESPCSERCLGGAARTLFERSFFARTFRVGAAARSVMKVYASFCQQLASYPSCFRVVQRPLRWSWKSEVSLASFFVVRDARKKSRYFARREDFRVKTSDRKKPECVVSARKSRVFTWPFCCQLH